MSTIQVKFKWVLARPDSRQYRQNSSEFIPVDVEVAVDVPLETEYIVNATDILSSKLVAQYPEPLPILSPAGVRYCLDKLGHDLTDANVIESSDEDWDDDKKPSKPAKNSDDDDDEDWDEDEKDSKDAPWNESDEDWE